MQNVCPFLIGQIAKMDVEAECSGAIFESLTQTEEEEAYMN